MTYMAVGAISDIGLSPYKIYGDEFIALVAQVNRFAGKTVSLGPGCENYGSKRFLDEPLPLLPGLITTKAADLAWLIASMRWDCAPSDLQPVGILKVADKRKWMATGATNTWAFVTTNRKELTITLAQYGDSLGLKPAVAGITEVDPKMKPKFPTTVAVIGALAVGAYLVSRRAK